MAACVVCKAQLIEGNGICPNCGSGFDKDGKYVPLKINLEMEIGVEKVLYRANNPDWNKHLIPPEINKIKNERLRDAIKSSYDGSEFWRNQLQYFIKNEEDSEKWNRWCQRNLQAAECVKKFDYEGAIQLYELNVQEHCNTPASYNGLSQIYLKFLRLNDCKRILLEYLSISKEDKYIRIDLENVQLLTKLLPLFKIENNTKAIQIEEVRIQVKDLRKKAAKSGGSLNIENELITAEEFSRFNTLLRQRVYFLKEYYGG